MAYDRDDARSGPRDQARFSNNRDRDPGGRGREERGFFERAGDEIASWFGDDDSERGHRRDAPMGGSEDGHGRDQHRGRPLSGWRDRGESREHWPMNRPSSSERDPWGAGDRENRNDRSGRGDRGYLGDAGGYRPLAGDYGRSEGRFESSGYERVNPEFRGRQDRGESEWNRDDARRARVVGAAESSLPHDPHYQEWRQRQLDELDRDYAEYRREHQSKFENDFGSWRSNRQTKRQMLGTIREHMDVVGSDGAHVGKVDRIAGDRIILAKSDEEAGGAHHSLSCSEITSVEGDRVMLGLPAAQARLRWRDESRDRALFERKDQGEAGPHALDRSFSGTYR